VLQSKIQWPTDTEFQQYSNQFQEYLNGNFQNLLCVVDGTEIRVSQPSNETNQKDLYSKKKKQFAINVLIICLLNGKIIYVSKHRKGAHDQSHWNELDLRSRFVGKDYRIAGDVDSISIAQETQS
jgi:hypothetical protein